MASRRGSSRDAGQIGPKTGRPVGNGTGGNPTHLKFNEFKSFTSAGHRCKQPDDTKIDRRAVVNNKKNPLCGLSLGVVTQNSTSNAIFDPIRSDGLIFYSRLFCAELHGLSFTKLRSRSHFSGLCEKVHFSQF
jgi:hypothetical protein